MKFLDQFLMIFSAYFWKEALFPDKFLSISLYNQMQMHKKPH